MAKEKCIKLATGFFVIPVLTALSTLWKRISQRLINLKIDNLFHVPFAQITS